MFRVGVMGCGRPWKQDGATGFGMSHAHAKGYNATGKCEIVATCDIVERNARLFSDEHAGGNATIYTDYKAMLAAEKLDFLSIATWPDLHAEMVIAAAEAGVRAIHCEKPMSGTWAESKAMAEACVSRGVLLSFNHQRRFCNTFQTARKMLKDGVIGDLLRLEGSCPNFMDWGTHWLNMFLYYNDESPAKWVMAQCDVRKPHAVYGVPHDTQGVIVAGFENGVFATLYTGEFSEEIARCSNRIVGTDGFIELHNSAPHIRYRGKGDATLKIVEGEATAGGLHGDDAIPRAIADLVDALETGREPLLSVSNALPTTEIIFAAYESARTRGRIDLPLTIADHPLVGMLASGAFPAGVA